MYKLFLDLNIKWDIFCEDYPFLAIPIAIVIALVIIKIFVREDKSGGEANG